MSQNAVRSMGCYHFTIAAFDRKRQSATIAAYGGKRQRCYVSACIVKCKRLQFLRIASSQQEEKTVGLIVSVVCLAIFVVNVAVGSIAGSPPLGNVAEMVLLFAASIFFVVHLLKCEARENDRT